MVSMKLLRKEPESKLNENRHIENLQKMSRKRERTKIVRSKNKWIKKQLKNIQIMYNDKKSQIVYKMIIQFSNMLDGNACKYIKENIFELF